MNTNKELKKRANKFIDISGVLELGKKYKISEMEFGSTTRVTGEKNFLNVNFLKKEFRIYSVSTLVEEDSDSVQKHKYLLSGGLSRNVFNKIVSALLNQGFKQI